jgi:hypothetical protein
VYKTDEKQLCPYLIVWFFPHFCCQVSFNLIPFKPGSVPSRNTHTHTHLSLSVYVSTTAWYWGADHSPPWVVSYDTIKIFVLLVLLLQPSKPSFQYWLLLLVSVGVWISSTCRVRHFHEVTKESIIWWQLTLRI